MRLEPGLVATADRALLRIVLDDLLGNAVKYTAERAVARVELTVTERNGERVYCVADNGVGFDMKYAGRLFGAFQRLHAASQFDGLGIGLATVKRIVRRHGGRIWAESAPEQGARVFFTLESASGVISASADSVNN